MGCSGSALREQNASLQQQLLAAERERSAALHGAAMEKSAVAVALQQQAAAMEKSSVVMALQQQAAAMEKSSVMMALQQQAAARDHDMSGLLAILGGKEAPARNRQLGSSQRPLMLPPPPVPPPQLPPLQ